MGPLNVLRSHGNVARGPWWHCLGSRYGFDRQDTKRRHFNVAAVVRGWHHIRFTDEIRDKASLRTQINIAGCTHLNDAPRIETATVSAMAMASS